MPLKKKLIILLIAFTLIPLATFGVVIFSQARTILKTVRIAQLNNIADLKKNKIETFFSERTADIRSIQNFLNIKRNLPLLYTRSGEGTHASSATALRELDSQLKPFQVDYGYLNLMLADQNSMVVYVSNDELKPKLEGKPLQYRHVYEEGKKAIYFSDIFVNEARGNTFEMYSVAPLKDLSGKFIGEVVIEIDMGPIYSFIQDNTGLGETGEVLIAEQDGNEVVFLSPLRNNPEAALKKRVTFNDTVAYPAQKAARGENGSGITRDYQGIEVLAAWRYIPFLRWGLVTKINADEAFAPVTQLRTFFMVAGFFVVALGAFVALAVSKTITGPLHSLQEGAEAIAAGDLGRRVGTNARDEVGQLSRAFDVMTDALVHDIAERRKAEEKIKKLNEDLEHHVAQLVESNKELEAFSYSVSHDLRSPLRGIDGFSLALLEDYADKLDDAGRDYLERIRLASQRMAQLIDDLLNLSRITRSEMKRERVDLSRIAQDIADRLKKNHPERTVEFVVSGGLTAYGDERLLRVALENLFGNAWKFTGAHEQSRIEFGSAKRDGRAAFFVKDDGAGFDMAYVDKLFGPFQRLHASSDFPGTGIGLATVQRIIHRHGGRVWIEGEVEKGATVYFTLS